MKFHFTTYIFVGEGARFGFVPQRRVPSQRY